MRKKISAETQRKAIRNLKRTLQSGSYYWRGKAYSVLSALENGLPLHQDEWVFWAKKKA
jgi:hypothetical protein